MTEAPPPAFDGVLETCLYHDPSEADEIERFYGEVLGMRLVARWPDGIAFRVGEGVLLLFDRERISERHTPISEHATTGAGHACLLTAAPSEYAAWRKRLEAEGVEITHEHEWGPERHSIYFHDPAGNLLEIADGDLWPP